MAKHYRVTKRNGDIEDFNVSKIRAVIDWAISSTNLQPLKLESTVNIAYKDLMSTEYIQMSLIDAALKLVSIEEPEWNIVAGRLYMMNHYKNISLQRNQAPGYHPSSFYYFIKSMVESGKYDKILLSYTKQGITELAQYIKPERDFLYDYAGATNLVNRYLLQDKSNILELPQEMFMLISMMIEAKFPSDDRISRVKAIYDLLSLRKISLATPILINLRTPKSNLSSCFILSLDDNLSSILYGMDAAAFISQEGGGVGVNVSRCRSRNSWIRGVPNRGGGVLPWAKIFNDIAISVNQLGKREGAITVSLDAWHYDILDFLDIQTENGDQRIKCYDIFPQVVIPNKLMNLAKDDDYWYMFDPYEILTKFGYDLPSLWGEKFDKVYDELVSIVKGINIPSNLDNDRFSESYLEALKKVLPDTGDIQNKQPVLVRKIKAKEFIKTIMKTQIETGMPYITFKDTINFYNPNKDTGYIPAGNLCQESFSNVKPLSFTKTSDFSYKTSGEVHTCNLLSIVLAYIEKEEIPNIAYYAVRILDNLIDVTETPVSESSYHNKLYRTLGVGIMGLADYLAKNKIKYTESSKDVEDIAEYISAHAFLASASLAQERGTFENYPQSELAKGIILGKNESFFKRNSKYWDVWKDVFAKGKEFGFRNSQLLAIAPNTSTSKLMGCTASILPVYGKMFIDNSKGVVPILPPFIKDSLWFYQENKHIDQKYVVDVTAALQRWVDTGISMELLFNLNNENITAKYIYDLYFYAWEQGIKTIYYIRTIQKNGSVSEKQECVSCSG